MANLTQRRFLSVRVAAPFLTISLAAFLVPVYLAAQGPAAAKNTTPAPAGKYVAPRLAEGRPDFTGFWSNNTATPVERPASFNGREYLTPEEGKAVEKASIRIDANRKKGTLGDYNAVFLEDGKRVVSTLRTSIITDPKDGRMPPLTPEAKLKADAAALHKQDHPFDGPEDLNPGDRCITGNGAPMLPRGYNNIIHFVQTPDYVAIAAEMMHDVRVIPIDGRAHGTARSWLGDGVGHYEGETLVVETTNFNGKRGWPRLNFGRRTDEKMKVTERFTRTAPDVLLYQFTVDDPGLFTRPYSGEITMWPSEHPVYEYACHEGNYSMPVTLSGARTQERAVANRSK